jgi:FkbM family methyltransferase
VIKVLSSIVRHPLNKSRPLAALWRFASWQIGTRFLRSAVAVPYVGSTRLLVKRGMTGATGNIYCGLHEFEDMALVLHALRPTDLFVDVGANIGSYTILAAGVAKARCLSIEPVPAAYASLRDNLRLNDLTEAVQSKNVAVGAAAGTLRFTADRDTTNHALTATESAASAISVPVATLDSLLEDREPAVIKIDVEGFEYAVVDGAEKTLRSAALLAVLMELNGSGERYGFSDDALHDRMLALGFTAARYDPLQRSLQQLQSKSTHAGNALYVRRWSELQTRLQAAPRHRVLHTDV